MKKKLSILILPLLALAIIAILIDSVGARATGFNGAYLPLITSPPVQGFISPQGIFTPHVIDINVGSTVQWQNNDNVVHRIIGDGWESAELTTGDTFSHQFGTPGIYQYISSYDTNVEGAVVVLDNGTPPLFDDTPVDQAYRDMCGGCHGPDREGGIGPALIPARLSANDAFYFDVIRNGRPGTIMPAWGSMGVSDEEVWMLIGLIRSEPDADAIEWGMDEIVASHAILVDEATLPSTPTHSGNLDNLMLVTEREARSIAVFDGDTHQLLSHIDASYRAHGYAFDPTNERWAYNVGRDGWLFKIDLYTLQAVTKVRVGHDSRGLAISDDGHYLIVGNFVPGTAIILDAQTLQPLKVIATEGNNPEGEWVESRVCITSDVAPDKVGPYFILGLKEAGQMWRIDYSDPTFPVEKLENVGHILHDGFLSPDNTRFYIAAQADNWMGVIDVENWTLVTQIETGDTPHPGSGAAWAANGTEYGATVHAGEGLISVWDLADNQIAAQIPTSGPGLFIRASDHNPYVWADALFSATPNEIYVIAKDALTVEYVITGGTQLLHPELTDDGDFVYISDWAGNAVRIYNARTFELVAVKTDVTTPTGIFNTSRRSETLGH